ncbi:hypothetical protein INS49_004078 [Diaporthe citri]|uniref:uncharacterized protein n=1 Tax=Diaporthe citri TaxID=83186 RepID=UPI001C7FB8F7|nr:uncharacterized protein INS49_004078 [Diaporthe citri]KAG6354997.1 hypothetical protein INS49_004078 [Diaporthe citri]
MTNDQTETGLPVNCSDEKRHANEGNETRHEPHLLGEGPHPSRGSNVCDSASVEGTIHRESLQSQTEQLRLEASGSRESASIITREASWHGTEGGGGTREEPTGTGAVANVKDEMVAHETMGSTKPIPPSKFEAETAEKQENKQRPSPPNTELPQWLIEGCVTTCEELKDSSDDLTLEEFAFPSVKKQLTSEAGGEPDGCQEGPPVYRMASILFEPLLGVLGSGPREVVSHIEASKRSGFSSLSFGILPKVSKADLITLDRNDLEDLADHFKRREKEQEVDDTSVRESAQDYLSFLFNRPIDSRPTSPGSETSGSYVKQRRD